jgi:mannose-6-phosphate isomerase-like protein (cupin superfamily)
VETKEEKMEKGVAHVPPGEGSKSLWVLGELVTYKVASEQTGGAYSLFEVLSQPQGGPLPHIQHREDECFYVLEGEFEFLNNGCVFGMGPGSLVYVPRGNLHAYKNVGNEPGKMLVSQTPGGLHERFLEKLGEPVTDSATPPVPEGPPELGRLVALAVKYGIEIPPSPEGDRRKETRRKGGDHR